MTTTTTTTTPTTTTSNDIKVSFSANFKDTKKFTPKIKDGFTVNVYFICDNILYKGVYHTNEQFYAYSVLGKFDCFASKNGNYKSLSGNNKNSICTHWCYVEEFKLTF